MAYGKILLAGHSGAGKSWSAAKAQTPYVLCFEPQGEMSAKAASLGAALVRRCSLDLNGLRSGLEALDEIRGLPATTTLVVDSLSAVQQACMREIAKTKTSKRVNHGIIRALNQGRLGSCQSLAAALARPGAVHRTIT